MISNLFAPIRHREQNGDTNRNPFYSPRAIAAVCEHQSNELMPQIGITRTSCIHSDEHVGSEAIPTPS
jgi:hypothetical protein